MQSLWLRSLALALIGCTLLGCALVPPAEEAVADIEQASTETETFKVSREQAEAVIVDAIGEGWPEKSPERLGDQRLAYEFTLWFAIDRERIIAEALPREDGYGFRVTNRGTAPVVGIPAREKLVPLIEKYARASSDGTAP